MANLVPPVDLPPGAVSCFLDELPIITSANVRPYVIAILLHRCSVSRSEIYACLTPQCSKADLEVGGWDPIENDYHNDISRMEAVVDEVLAEYVSSGLLQYKKATDRWSLTTESLTSAISWASATNSRLPQSLLLKIEQKKLSTYNHGSKQANQT
jgi:hypothetical protein